MKRTVLLGVLLAASVSAQDADRFVSLDVASWDVQGEVKQGETLGRPALQLRSGRAIRRDVALADGTVEFDMVVSGQRSFVYLLFRMESDRDFEELYFRPHKDALPDAAQYSPVYRGISNWQLYHGPGATAAVDLPAGRWIHVRLVLSGGHAFLFMDRSSEPRLVIPLAREPKAGAIALRGFVPANLEAELPVAASFSNLEVRPGDVPEGLERFVPEPAAPPAGVVRRWCVSQAFVPAEGALEELPAEVLDGPWRELPTEPSGLLVLFRHLERPEGTRRPAVLTRLKIQAERAGVRRFDFGYSDEVTVFLNGRRLLYADDRYSFDQPRRQGLIGLHQASLFLPLGEGENELILAVADSFGGWGLMGRFPDRGGLDIAP